MSPEVFLNNLSEVRGRIARACDASNRSSEEVALLPVTKTWPAEAVRFAFSAGFCSVGENRVMEALKKMEDVKEPGNWELIGHLQSKKAKFIPNRFARVQSVDSEKLLNRLDAAAANANCCLRVLLQVNAGKDPAKFGVFPEETDGFLEAALSCSNLKVEGFMTIAPFAPEDPSIARSCFESLRELRDRLVGSFEVELTELSMGMSGDMEEAIRAGSTLVRVGSALFGERPQRNSSI
ncbi:MAG: YggS family pyridoxal phosphate-dependent enzyme [Opitutae bacterium]|jgi:PLP dependent protein|nr:YggS family pyridoxal phosphate-dependent enzyme [Opitutae bacterium]MBT7742925.1 YggS family pyridoxal phosphate-dependent enzyme [Opitutae bacterium]MBT7923546.1 YggS family pyridoxal phosphate-dependent enzyme [Opitutae bacterium]